MTELDTVTTLEKLAKRQLGYYRSMEDDLKGQLEAGNPVYGRFSEIDVERTDLEQRLNDLKAERVAVEARTNPIGGRSAGANHPRAGRHHMAARSGCALSRPHC